MGGAPERFGSRRAEGEATVEVRADDLYGVFDPSGFDGKWTVREIARLVDALPELGLPFYPSHIKPKTQEGETAWSPEEARAGRQV